MNKQINPTVRRPKKTAAIYFILSAVSIAVDNIYALFGHGVRSYSMSFMFLYPLIGGMLIFLLLGFIAPEVSGGRMYRSGYNLYNFGIATLTTGSFFKGILDIAGTASEYTVYFFIAGWSLAAAGLTMLIVTAATVRRGD